MTQGIHHITAIASSAAACVRFYTHILGLRLVKKSVNQDDVGTYHLFFGDRLGHPGMDLTFFIFLPPMIGKQGNGLVTNVSFAVPLEALSFWEKRFDTFGVIHGSLYEHFGAKRLPFEDGDGMHYELVGVADNQVQDLDVWTMTDISKDTAIRHFYHASLSMPDRQLIEPLLTEVFGYTQTAKEGNVYEYRLPSQTRASQLEIIEDIQSPLGLMGAGTVHHIAFRAKDAKEQLSMREKIITLGLMPTEVINRFYFHTPILS